MSDNGVRCNIAEVSEDERIRLRNAILELNGRKYPGSRNDQPLAGEVSYWFKQDEIHQATHVHCEPGFLPWREIVNRFEALLREIDPGMSLRYWDWRTDPVNGSVNLFTEDFMGQPHGQAQKPWSDGKFYDPAAALFRSDNAFDTAHRNPADPPKSLSQDAGSRVPNLGPQDEKIIAAETFPQMRSDQPPGGLEFAHNLVHPYIGGNLGNSHISFRDPFVFLLHSNVDRIFASWQLQSGKEWKLDPDKIYGGEKDTKATGVFPARRPGILTPLEPWAGLDPHWEGPKPDDPEKGAKAARPWAQPENLEDRPVKNSRHPSVVEPPLCGKYVGVSPGSPAVESLQPAAPSPDGKVWHTWRNPDGSWQAFRDVTGRAEVAAGAHPGPLSALSCRAELDSPRPLEVPGGKRSLASQTAWGTRPNRHWLARGMVALTVATAQSRVAK